LYLTEEEWNAQRKKREAENHTCSGTRGGGIGKGRGCGQGRSRGVSSSSGSSSKSTSDECRCCGKMGHWARKCRSMPKKEQAHVTQDEEEASLMLALATLIRPEVISSSAEVEIHERRCSPTLTRRRSAILGYGS
jgi:hypothetical protein